MSSNLEKSWVGSVFSNLFSVPEEDEGQMTDSLKALSGEIRQPRILYPAKNIL